MTTSTNQPTNQPDAYEQLSNKHAKALDWIINEINELNNDKNNDDKIESDVIVNEELNKNLKSYLEKNPETTKILLDKIKSINTANLTEEVKNSLATLINQLTWITNKETEKNKNSFEKFKKIIEENRLKDLNSLKHEVDGIKAFVNDTKNFIETLNLYAKMATLPADAYKRFLSTDREVYNSIFNTIGEKFNINNENDKYGKAKSIQLGTILQPQSATKESLKDIAKTYLWIDNRNGKNIVANNDWNFAEGIELIANYKEFVNAFNKINQKIDQASQKVPQNPQETGGNWEETPQNPQENGGNWEETSNWSFDKTVEKKWIRMDETRVKQINETAGEHAFLKLDWEKLSYNLDNVKAFLTTIATTDSKDFRSYYRTPGNPKRTAWLAATQILLNENVQNNKVVVDGEYKWKGETYKITLAYQKHYNEGHQDKLKEDWIPGPKTLSKLLWITENTWWGDRGNEWENWGNEWENWWNEWLDEKDFYDYEKEIINTDSEKFYEWYDYKNEEIEAHHHYKRWRIIENIKSHVDNIKENENINHKKIIEEIRWDLVTLPKKEKINIIKWVHTVVKKFETIRSHIKDIKNNPKERLCKIRKVDKQDTIRLNPNELKGEITVKQKWIQLAFFIKNDADFYYIRNWKKWDGREKIESGWFNSKHSRIPELEWTLTVVRWEENNQNSGIVTSHEWQHNWNTYFMTEKVEKKDGPIVHAKDEIIAYLRAWFGDDIQKIEDTLTWKTNSLYNYGLSGQALENHRTMVRELLSYVKGLQNFVKNNIIEKDKVISMLSDTPHTERKNLYNNVKKSVDNGTVWKDYWRAWTETQEAEKNQINLANSIKEVKHILNDPKYSHISWIPNNKWWIEVSMIIDNIMEKAKKTPLSENVWLKFISPDIRQKVWILIIKESPESNREKLKEELINSFPDQEKEEARKNIESQLS